MKKIIIALVVIIVLGIAYWLGSPLFIDKRVSEEFPTAENPAASTTTSARSEIVAEGVFAGFDSVHQGSGSMKLIKTADGYVIRFDDDFTVSNGPDLYVGFGNNGTYVKGSDIARLKGNIGSQNYEVPAGINPTDYNEVWVWCRAFSVGFARATYDIGT
jgi:hypothetical protein